mmetsp:Transcript_40824/g.80596  ORF Transcript_40824/g.80596 Transcript_40824/m.80596 type:complete len:417 (+) Transcript_40824:59-1309(+)|eukprot:CAMPEP_0172837362 /NCGR_PEP_ID=MMETSP1075-20121228/27140_1 /TAXON_ID=2916 /ORGANISM="Ceratium fusus, Strain PA161109" /LENGTH=416 /DNA_ID=CAMNT_0013680735 /DNA_START=45 /DNA_END=1295 /DNA_ORIENTATION=+
MKFSFAKCVALTLILLPSALADDTQLSPHKKLRKHRHHHHKHGAAKAKAAPASPAVQQAPLVSEPAVTLAAPATPPAATQVPAAINAGPGGYPQLPAVSSMLGSASQTLQNINAQARVLEARVVQTQMENEAKMARQKAVFEQKLKSQEDRSRDLQATNKQVSGEIDGLRANISALRSRAKDLQGANDIRRREMTEISGRLSRANEFLLSSLKVTNDEQAPELDVLRGKRSSGGLARRKVTPAVKAAKRVSAPVANVKKLASEEDDSDSKDDEDTEDASFIALSSTHTLHGTQPAVAAGGPKDVLNSLGEAVDNLKKEEHASEAQLKSMFLTNFKAGVKRYAVLAAQQRTLLATRKALIAEQGKLIKADEHLQGTSMALEQQLRTFGLFAQRLAHLALAPAQEAATLLKTLPTDVA